MVQRTSLQEDCPADHPGLQGASRSPRAPKRAFSAPTESMMQWLPSCWCLLCRMTYVHVWHMLALHIPCHACTHIHGKATRTHTFLPAQRTSCSIADYNNLICICFVLLFHFFVFPGDTTGTHRYKYLQVAIITTSSWASLKSVICTNFTDISSFWELAMGNLQFGVVMC